MNDDFSSSVGMPAAPERELPSRFPKPEVGTAAAPKMKVRYAKFYLDESGSEALEAIMNECVSGRAILCEEKWFNSKEGDTSVVVKYMTREDTATEAVENTVIGRRRQRKALEKKGG